MLTTRNIKIEDIENDYMNNPAYDPVMFIVKNDMEEVNPEEKHQSKISTADGSESQEQFKQILRDVISSSPEFIRDIVSKFTSTEEQVMTLYSTLALTGSLMPYVRINYDNKINYPALMLLVIFPPASGKGCMSLVRKLGQKIDDELNQQYSDQMRQYKMDLAVYNNAIKKGLLAILPTEPKQVLFLGPGDTTTARLVKQLSENGPGQFLSLFETEADVLSDSAGNSQYGKGLSTLIRKAFQFESISQMRKTAGELLVANTPKLSVILSGTANQVTRMFKDNEDGMYSRFLIIIGAAPAIWKNVKPDPSKQPLDDYFIQQADEFYNMWTFFKGLHAEVKFTDNQWDQINAFGESHLAVMHNFIDELSGSIAKRHANMLTRIAAILTMLRYYEANQTQSEIECSDEDFKIALWMTTQSLNWSLELYKELPGKKINSVVVQKNQIFEGLPNEFELSDALIQFKHIARRTLQRRIKNFVDSNLLISTGHGRYQKTEMAQLALSQFKREKEDN